MFPIIISNFGVLPAWPAKYAHLKCTLFLWFADVHTRNVPVSDEELQIKARCFGEQLAITDFSYFHGWVYRHTVQSEAGGADG